MKVGDLVTWYSEGVQDIGVVIKHRSERGPEVYIVWSSNDGNGWFMDCHPSIGVIR